MTETNILHFSNLYPSLFYNGSQRFFQHFIILKQDCLLHSFFSLIGSFCLLPKRIFPPLVANKQSSIKFVPRELLGTGLLSIHLSDKTRRDENYVYCLIHTKWILIQNSDINVKGKGFKYRSEKLPSHPSASHLPILSRRACIIH